MGRRFVAERRRDPFYRAAQSEGLRSRAAFKLEHLLDRYPILRAGDRVLDLGAAPGGWSIVAVERVGRRGEVVAVDPRPIEPIDGVTVVRGTVGSETLPDRLGHRPFDAVLSDMSPRISGAYATDHARSVALVRAAFELADHVLAAGGSFVAKVFAGEEQAELDADLAPSFRRWVRTKPPASRESSSELYLIGLGYHAIRKAP
ncbi:MAG: RlmE family RNA methyltransferase [Thermoplasmata archaeon]|nr:RlmE family RNA methyltransferase [Thermoplasmata archaeon]MCI4356814.1 RlmE family RNA methyltransferase [Thermoplasmata archaeon]